MSKDNRVWECGACRTQSVSKDDSLDLRTADCACGVGQGCWGVSTYRADAAHVFGPGMTVWGWAPDDSAERVHGPYATREEAEAKGPDEHNGSDALGFVMECETLDAAQLANDAADWMSEQLLLQINDAAGDLGGFDGEVFVLRDDKAASNALADFLREWAAEHVILNGEGSFYVTGEYLPVRVPEPTA